MKNTEIKVKTFLLDGTECGEMTIDLYFACKAWSVTDFRKFLKTVVTPSDKATGENTPDEIADYVTETMKDWTAKIVEQVDDTDCLKAFFGGDYTEFKRYIQPKSLASDFRKFDNFLKIASPEKYEEFQSWKESQNPDKQETLSAEETTETHCRIELKNENGETVDYFSGKNKTESELLEEMRTRRGMLGENMPDYETIVYTETTTPEPETVKGESTMKENTNAVVQATEEIELTAEQLEMLDFHGLKQNAESIKFVRDMGVESECFRAVKNLKSVASNGAKIITFPRIYSMKVGNGEATEYKYFEYCVCYKKGSYYKMPESVIKSSACEIIFRVISNSGKSVTIQTFEKYNGKTTGKLAEALGKLDRMRYKLDHGYISTSNSRYYAGFFAAVRAIFGEIMYNPETVKFEVGKIYCTISITNSDYLHAYKIISRTDKTIILENSAGERVRKRPTTTEHYKNGKKIMCETVYPDGKYSMCLVLDASEICTAGTPKQAENEHFRAAQERTRQAVKAVQQRQSITQTTTQNGTKITMTAGAAT